MKKTSPTNTEVIDISFNQDKSVIAYNDESTGSQITYIEANGNIKFPVNSSKLFYQFGSLKNIEDLEFVNTSRVTDMTVMFDGCSSLLSVNLKSFDTSTVTDMTCMFYDSYNLTDINLSSFNTGNVTTMGAMFYNCCQLTNLDLSNFDISKVTIMNSMFWNCNNLQQLKINDLGTNENVEITISSIFLNCSNLTTTITIRSTKISNYCSMFLSAATRDGSLITVNYTSETEALVDKMIATKSTNSNVVKGIQVD